MIVSSSQYNTLMACYATSLSRSSAEHYCKQWLCSTICWSWHLLMARNRYGNGKKISFTFSSLH